MFINFQTKHRWVTVYKLHEFNKSGISESCVTNISYALGFGNLTFDSRMKRSFIIVHYISSFLYTVRIQYTLHIARYTLYTTQYTLYNTLCTLYIVQYTLYNAYNTLHAIQYTPCTTHYTVNTIQYTLYTIHYTLHYVPPPHTVFLSRTHNRRGSAISSVLWSASIPG